MRPPYKTRCQCSGADQKPHIEPKGVIVWCDNCNKIIFIPLIYRAIITTAVS